MRPTDPATGPGHQLKAIADVSYVPFWLDTPSAPDALPALVADTRADLAVVGGGFSGLWTALLAKERDAHPAQANEPNMSAVNSARSS